MKPRILVFTMAVRWGDKMDCEGCQKALARWKAKKKYDVKEYPLKLIAETVPTRELDRVGLLDKYAWRHGRGKPEFIAPTILGRSKGGRFRLIQEGDRRVVRTKRRKKK